jgi:hypothetical protein
MTRTEARKLIRKHALTQYSATAVLLLLKLLDATYRKENDNIEARIEIPAKRLMQAAGIQKQQLGRILDQMYEDNVLLDMERGKDVSCYLNLEPLTKLATFADVQKAETQSSERRTHQSGKRKETGTQERGSPRARATSSCKLCQGSF